jgi:PKHD-type hydroxylase
MRGEWCYFKNHFTPEECKTILEMGLKLPAEDAKLGVDGAYSNDQWRKSKIRFIKKEHTQFEWLFDRMWKMAIQANDDYFDFHLSKIEYMQLAEYDSAYQGEYKKHHDVFWMNNDPKYHRKISAVVQLTDPSTYEGGNFEVFADQKPNAEELRTQGTAIFIPSFLNHQATQVTSGVRYSLACWFDGPKWR